MIIDGHSHVNYPLAEHIHNMNQNNVSKTILFRTLVHPEKATNFIEIQNEMNTLNKLLNGNIETIEKNTLKSKNELIDAIQAYPERYIGFGFVPIGLTEKDTLSKINSEILENKLVGLGEYTLASGTVSLIENIFKASSYYKNLPIWIHGFNPIILSDIIEITKLAKSCPDIPVIIGHLGGSNWLETISFVKETPNLYLDISAYFSTLVLKMIINEIPEKCIFGVDLPYGDLELSIKTVKKYTHDTSIYNLIMSENIISILNL